LDYESKKRSRYSASQLSEIKNSLYQLNVSATKQPLRYTARTQPIFKDRRLLRDYQLESLNWMIEAFYSNRNVLLADEMGLGKTIQSIAFLNYLYQLEACRGPFLVVAPLSTLAHWKRTVEEWTTLNVVLYYDQAGIEGR
jgi:chromodomain-helicase-DNA-binding protein 7